MTSGSAGPADKRRARAAYHHGDLANALLQAGIELAREGGPEAVALRAVAAKVSVSPTAAYRHYAGHEDLMRAVKQQALEMMADAMDKELNAAETLPEQKAEAIRRSRAMATAYVTFATSEPGLFRTAFGHDAKLPHLDLSEMLQFRAFAMCSGSADALVASGAVPAERRPGLEIAIWSSVHGLSTLLLDGPLSCLPDDVVSVVKNQAIDNIVAAFTH